MDGDLTVFYLMTALVVFMIGLAKGGLGGTLGALATPLMAMVMPANQVIGLLLPILMFADIFAVALHWAHWNLRLVGLLLPGSIAGVTIGTLFITNTPTSILRLTLGIIVLVFAIYKFLEDRLVGVLVYRPREWHGLLAGTVAGFSSALAHTGGPPVSVYLLMQNITPRVFIATSALFFMILNWVKVPYYLYARLFDWPHLLGVAWLMPLVPFGVWVGKWASGRVSKRVFERIIVAILALAALLLILT